MASVFECDICQKRTVLNPQVEHLFEEKEFEVDVPVTTETEVEVDTQDGGKAMVKRLNIDARKEKRTVRSPKMATMKRQNIHSGVIEDIPIHETRDLSPRTYIVRLTIGNETVQRDFCRDCLSDLMPGLKTMWTQLSAIKSN